MSENIMAKALDIQKLVEYQDDTVVSREVIKKELGTERSHSLPLIRDRDCQNTPLHLMRWFRLLTVKLKLQFQVSKTL